MSGLNSNYRGSLYPSFSIGKSGITIYQGTSAPSIGTGNSGDFYLQQNGTLSLSYVKQGTAWVSNITQIVASGDVSGTGNATITLTLGTTGVTAGTYGGGTNFPQIVVDSKGRITSGTTVALGSMAGQNSNSVTITGGTISGLNSPTASSDAATKGYVDAAVSGLNIHPSVQWATTGTLNGTYAAGTIGADGGSGVGATITRTSGISGISPDGTTASVGDRILVKDQTSPIENGIYVVTTVGGLFTAWVLTRASDYDNNTIATDVADGDFMFVTKGSVNADSGWVQTESSPIIVGTSNITFTQFSGAGQITAGTGLTKVANTLSVGTNAISATLFRQSVSNSLVGNSLGSAADVQDIIVGGGLSLASGTLSVIGDGTGSVTNVATGTGLTGGPITNTGTISMGTSGVTAGTFGDATNIPQITVDALGRITVGTNISITYGTGSVTSIVAGTDLTGGTITNTGTLDLGATGVTAGTYGSQLNTSIVVVDNKGRITSASSGTITLGTGSVTSVAINGSDGIGVTGSPIIDNDTITLTLGTITPDAVSAVGAVTGSNLSGTNTGDQTITLTGDVTGSGTGSFATTLGSVVTAGTYNQVVVGTKGLVTSGTFVSPTTNAGYFSPGAAANAGTSATFYSALAPAETINRSLVLDTLYAIPVLLPANFPITRIGFQLTTVGAPASVLRMGIYSNDSTAGLPKDLLVDAGTVDIRTSTGMKEIAINYTTTGEWVWLVAVHNSSSNPNILGFDIAGNAQNLSNLLGRSLSTGSATGFISASYTFGTLGTTFPATPSFGTTSTPFLWVRSV